MILKDEITKVLEDALKKMNVSAEKLVVSFSNRPELCDFQTNFALIASKELGKKPIEVANEIVENVGDCKLFDFSAVMPGFVNIKV